VFFSNLNAWKQRTTPLPWETVENLCNKFALTERSLCKKDRVVYAPDFYKIIREAFRPYKEFNTTINLAATYNEVESRMGDYRYECEPVATGNDTSFFTCYYDLRGDREFIIGIIYIYPDMAVYRINTPMGNDND
jgi:hypothetical protein